MIANAPLHLGRGFALMERGEKMKWVDEGRVPSKVFFSYGVDAVEVVRCKDCTHAKEMTQYGCGECVRHCEKLKIVTSPEWYCAEGRRKDEGGPD